MWSHNDGTGGQEEEIVLGAKIKEMMEGLVPTMAEALFKDIIGKTVEHVRHAFGDRMT